MQDKCYTMYLITVRYLYTLSFSVQCFNVVLSKALGYGIILGAVLGK